MAFSPMIGCFWIVTSCFNPVTGKKQTMLANQKFLRNASRHKRYDDDDDDDDDKWVVVNSDS